MGLLSPWFLAGLGLLGLPVWLHLLKRRKSTPQQFSSVMFFEKSTTSSVRQRQLAFLLLFALRLLLVLFAVFAFSRPFLRDNAVIASQNDLLVLAVDRSASMAYGDRFEQARRAALNVLNSKSGQQRAQVFAFAAKADPLTQVTHDAAALRAPLEKLTVSTSRSSLADLAAALRNLSRTTHTPATVHLFSDLQRSSMPASFADLRLDPGMKLVIHSVADKTVPNWAVQSVTAPSRVDDPKQAHVQAVIQGYHTEAAAKPVVLRVNGREVGRQTAQVPASGAARVDFAGFDIPYGFARCEVVVEAKDGLAVDNRWLFSMERSDPEKVLVIASPAGQRAAVYLRAALDTAAPGLFAVNAVSTGAAASAPFNTAAFVVLSDPGALPPAAADALTRYVQSGGGVLIATGTVTATAGKVPVTGASISGSSYASRQDERFLSAGSIEKTHPVLGRSGDWDGARFYQIMRIDAPGASVLVRASNGTPLLYENKLGGGRVLTFASTLDNGANDFPVQPSFVPFMEQAARWLGRIGESTAGMLVDASLELRKPGQTGESVEVLDPDGNRALSLAESTSRPALPLERAGFWEVRRRAGRTEVVAVNVDRRESDLEPMPAESAELWQGSPAQAGKTPGSTNGTGGPDPNIHDLWPYLLALALAVAVVEGWVARKYTSREAA